MYIWDKLVLSDHNWKRKYCPTLYSWVFGNEEERHGMWLKIAENASKSHVCPACHGIYWDENCPECNGRHVCGGYVLQT